MAQIIKHRRGSIGQIASVTANVGELVMATGSIGDLTAPVLFIGDSATAGGYKAVSKIYQGSSAPDLTSNNWGSTLNGTPFYSSNDKTLYILNNAGNTDIDLTGNIEGNTISGVTINALTSSFVSGAFIGDASGLYNIPATVTSLPKGVKGVGINGSNCVGPDLAYAPPHSKGPGVKKYTITVYALSEAPKISVSPKQVNRDVLLAAIKGITLAQAELNFTYDRTGVLSANNSSETRTGKTKRDSAKPNTPAGQ